MQFTTKQLMAANGLTEKEGAYGLIQFLRAKELIKEAGHVPQEKGKKGRGEIIFEGDSFKIIEALSQVKFA